MSQAPHPSISSSWSARLSRPGSVSGPITPQLNGDSTGDPLTKPSTFKSQEKLSGPKPSYPGGPKPSYPGGSKPSYSGGPKPSYSGGPKPSYSGNYVKSRQEPTQGNKVKARQSERLTHLLKTLPLSGNPDQIVEMLDVGCGNAEITQEIGLAYQVGKIYGADVYASQDFKVTENNNKVEYSQIKNNMIGLPDASVNLVTCFMSIHHFEDFSAMMKEIKRVLRPGGWLFIREHDVASNNLVLKRDLDRRHLEYPDHPGGNINYWDRQELVRVFHDDYSFIYLNSSEYPAQVRNPQAIYHSLFKYQIE
jgi:SAM-dependent methyltransferase